jgi:tetratricopeptide (TPR) repeat protein
MENELQLDLATMALKGRRYDEAEKLYMQIATQNNSTEAWVGMGICKLYQLANGRTMDEAIFCFERARKMTPEMQNDIESQAIVNTLFVMKAYMLIVEEAMQKQLQEKNKAIFGAVLTGVSLIAGMNSKSAFGTIASLSGTGAGVGVAVDSLNNISNYNELILSVLKLCDDANNGIRGFVQNKNELYNEFEKEVVLMYESLENAKKANQNQDVASKTKEYVSGVLENNQGDKWYHNNTKLALSFLVWPVAVYGIVMRVKSKKK